MHRLGLLLFVILLGAITLLNAHDRPPGAIRIARSPSVASPLTAS